MINTSTPTEMYFAKLNRVEKMLEGENLIRGKHYKFITKRAGQTGRFDNKVIIDGKNETFKTIFEKVFKDHETKEAPIREEFSLQLFLEKVSPLNLETNRIIPKNQQLSLSVNFSKDIQNFHDELSLLGYVESTKNNVHICKYYNSQEMNLAVDLLKTEIETYEINQENLKVTYTINNFIDTKSPESFNFNEKVELYNLDNYYERIEVITFFLRKIRSHQKVKENPNTGFTQIIKVKQTDCLVKHLNAVGYGFLHSTDKTGLFVSLTKATDTKTGDPRQIFEELRNDVDFQQTLSRNKSIQTMSTSKIDGKDLTFNQSETYRERAERTKKVLSPIIKNILDQTNIYLVFETGQKQEENNEILITLKLYDKARDDKREKFIVKIKKGLPEILKKRISRESKNGLRIAIGEKNNLTQKKVISRKTQKESKLNEVGSKISNILSEIGHRKQISLQYKQEKNGIYFYTKPSYKGTKTDIEEIIEQVIGKFDEYGLSSIFDKKDGRTLYFHFKDQGSLKSQTYESSHNSGIYIKKTKKTIRGFINELLEQKNLKAKIDLLLSAQKGMKVTFRKIKGGNLSAPEILGRLKPDIEHLIVHTEHKATSSVYLTTDLETYKPPVKKEVEEIKLSESQYKHIWDNIPYILKQKFFKEEFGNQIHIPENMALVERENPVKSVTVILFGEDTVLDSNKIKNIELNDGKNK